MMNLTLYVTRECPVCIRVENSLRNYTNTRNNVVLITKRIEDVEENKVFIVPALFVNHELFTYGEVDLNKLDSLVRDMKK